MIRRLIPLLAFFVLLFAKPAAVSAQDLRQLYLPTIFRPSQILYKNPVTYVVDKYVTITNTDFNLSKLEIYQPKAVSWDSQQVSANDLYPAPTSVSGNDEHGNQVIYWVSTNAPAAGQSMIFKQHFTVTVYEIEAKIDPADVKPYDTSSALYQRYTRPEYLLESSDPLIVQTAQAAVGSETNPYLKAKRIYESIAPLLFYTTNDGADGALETLKLGSGECGDYAAVFVAMARAAGIPARPVVGYHAYSGAQHHVWAEFYLQDIGWVPLDAQAGDMGDTASAWFFGHNPNTRIILSKNYNIALPPSTQVAELLQTYYWWFWGFGGSPLKSEDGWSVSGP